MLIQLEKENFYLMVIRIVKFILVLLNLKSFKFNDLEREREEGRRTINNMIINDNENKSKNNDDEDG